MIKSPSASFFIALLVLWTSITSIHALPPTGHSHRSLVRRRECLNTDGAGPSGAPGWPRSETCSSDGECASGLCCDNTDGTVTCRGKGFASPCKLNAECGDNFCDSQFECRSASFNDKNSLGRRCTTTWPDSCASGLTCDGATETCIANSVDLRIGDKCERSEPCVSNFCAGGICVNPEVTVVTDQGIGERCFKKEQCKSGNCGPESTCIEATEMCGSGPGCETGTVCEGGNCVPAGLRDDENCEFDSQCQIGSCHNNKCRNPVEENGTCDESSDCEDGSLACVSSVCIRGGRPLPNGGVCSEGSNCLSGICENKICVAALGKIGNGGDCSEGDNCVSGICTNGKCTATEPSNGKGGLGSDCSSPQNCLSNVCSGGKCIAEVKENETSPTPTPGDNGTPQTIVSTVNGQRQTVTVTPSAARATGARTTSASTGAGETIARSESAWMGGTLALVAVGMGVLL